MGRLASCVALVLVTSTVTSTTASADDGRRLEAGLFGGGFISNFFHQFYDVKIVDRPELERVNPEVGVRAAYFLTSWIGLEGEFSWMDAHTKPGDMASIYSARAQAIFQYDGLPVPIVPFVAAGVGMMHV